MKHHFNRSIKNSYSWLPKGRSSSIINLNKRGAWSIIAALWSDREYIIQAVKSTINQLKSQQFIYIINYYLQSALKSEIRKVNLSIDNASTHTSSDTRKLFLYFDLNV